VLIKHPQILTKPAKNAMTSSETVVLVTGGSGFIASHLILQLLQKGYRVRTTVRNLSREPAVRTALATAGAPSDTDTRLSFFAADLGSDNGWADAVQGCVYVHHVASPFPLELPKHEDDLIIPARDGTLRVLRAARDAGVKRVVLTSSFAAIGYGWSTARKDIFTEKDWSIIDSSQGVTVPPYPKSKVIAERAAWDFMESHGGDMQLAVINPGGVFGPVLGKEVTTSVQIIKKLMDGTMAFGCPQITLGIVDVRDIADLHIRAMLDPNAKGERFLGVADQGVLSFLDIARIIKAKRPEHAKKVGTVQLPNLLLRVAAMFDVSIRQMLPELGRLMQISNDKAKNRLEWAPRSTEESILDTVDSLVQGGLL
jgi:nucleoside-diphosphate-sugar epimerase